MTNNRIPLNQLITNAKNGVISRERYIEKIIESIVNAPLYYFADRGAGQSSCCDTIEEILSELKLPKNWVDNYTFKDLIFVMYHFYRSEDEEMQNLALNALMKLSDIAINNFYYKYER